MQRAQVRSLREQGAETLFQQVREHLAAACDVAPAEIVLVEPGAITKTSSGKIRRLACRQAYGDGTLRVLARSSVEAIAGTASEPRTYGFPADDNLPLLGAALRLLEPAQKAPLIARWLASKAAQLLRVPELSIAPDQPLCLLGFDSLRAVEFKHAVEELLSASLPLARFLSEATLTELANELTTVTPAPETGVSTADDIEDDDLELSYPQQGIFTVHRLDPRSIAYNLHLALGIKGHLDQEALKRSVARLVEAHPVLRTVYRADGTSMSAARLPTATECFSVVEAADWSERQLQEDFTQRTRAPFDLEHGPVIRLTLYVHGNDRHTLLFCAHHIALDLWSLLILIEQLQRIYASASSASRVEATTAAARYRDFVHSQRDYVASGHAEAAFAYWRSQLSGELPLLALPTDYARANSSSNEGASHVLRIGKELTAKLKALAREHGATLFMTLLAAYKVLLYRYTHQTDIIVGVPSSGRTDGRYARVVGNFVNPVAVRTYPSPELPFTAFLQHVREAVLGALAHEQFPFSVLVERLQPKRHGEEWPIYQTMFVLQQAQSAIDANLSQLALGEDGTAFSLGEWQVHPIAIHERVENFDLKVMAAECEEGLIFSFQYRRQLFQQETIAQIAAHFDVLLRGIIANPNARLADLPLLTEPERYRLLVEWNATQVNYPKDKCVHQLFEAQVERTPQATAVVYEEQSLSYRELNAKANQLAHHLRALGVDPDTLVGICVERSLEMVVGLLGILKARGAYLPLDPTYPKERLAYMLEDARPSVLLTQARLRDALPEHSMLLCLDTDWALIARRSKKNCANLSSPLNLAYVIYTSGSAGKPKGVLVSHRNAVHSTCARFSYYRESVEAFLWLSSFAFDSSVAGLFWTLCQGGRLCLPAEGVHKDPRALGELIARHRISQLLCLPSLYGWLLEQAHTPHFTWLRTVIVAGEPCPREVVARHFTQLSQVGLFNEYGPTEGTVWSSVYEVKALDAESDRPIAIGRPIACTQIYLLDADLNPVPVGVNGELYLGGVGLARGYLHRPTLTAERFIPNPFGEAGSRLYRTGDLARYRSDGNMEYLGRIDHQVKVRGFRIELGEIEARLAEHPVVREAVVVAREDVPGEKRLVAYVVGSGEWPENESIEQLRTHLGEILPDYMVPAAFVFLDSLPLTRTGKLDRNALPAPDVAAQLACQYVAPRTQLEAALAQIWADVLHVDRVGIHDSFFSLGGDSVRGIQMVSRANQAGYKLTPRLVFQNPTVVELAQVVEPVEYAIATSIHQGQAALDRTMQLTPERFPLASLRQHELDALPLKPHDVEDIYPLAPMQEGMLFHTLAQPGTGVYVMQDRYEVRGTIDVNAFRQAWQRLVDHHPILRSSFLWDTETRAHQVVHRHVVLPFEFQDWRGLAETEQRMRLEDLLQAEQRNGFDLSVAPLIRIRLLQLEDQRNLCIRTFHHIIMDDWCTSPLFMEFKENYLALSRGMLAPRREVRPFRDYLSWLTQRDPSDAEQFWRSYLDGYTEPTPLAVERSSVRRQETNRAVSDIVTELSVPDTELLKTLARRHQLTVNTFVQGALALLLGHYAGRTEVVFGVTVAGRPTTLPGVESMIGLFINGLPLRVRIRPEQPVIEWLRDVLTQNLEQRQYEYVPLVKIQSWSEIPRAQAALFQHLLTFENAPLDPSLRARSDALDMEWVGNRVHTNYPMTFVAIPASRLLLRLTYGRERFDGSVMERMVDHFRFLLEGLLHRIDGRVGEIALLGTAERQQLCNDWNSTVHEYVEPRDLIGRFEVQVAKTPEAIAVVCGDARSTYRELNTRANRVAHGLIQLGVGPDALVALLDDRSVEFLVMMLGIFKASGAYVPLDPAHPDGRMVQVLEESRVRFMLCGERYRARAEGLIKTAAVSSPTLVSLAELEAHAEVFPNPPRRHTEQNLAFVIYTSGSTGKPKGAMVEHRGMFNNLITKVPALGLTSTDVIAQTASQCFDISVWQFLTALVIGARVEVFPDEISRDPARLLEQLAARGVTILETVPSMILALLEIAEAGTELPALRWLMPCGEAFPPELCRQWMQRFPDLKLLNAYGPAECSDDVSYHPIELPGEGDLTVPIGRPVHNTRLYLLNRWLDPVPIGVPGEICVGGVQVGRGYLNCSDLTAASFIPDPFGEAGGRLYRTGDLGRYRSDGVLEFLGRIDHQVKIRGHRIEPGEIEACLVTHPEVREACVVPREVSEGVYRLVAYVVGAVREVGELRAHILKTLPEYMVPAAFVFLEVLPLTPNGKVDRKRLPDPDIEAQLAHQYVAPRNATEEILTHIWAEVLGVERVGVHDNFFELGGDSILSIQIVSRARRAGLLLTPRHLFDHPRIAELATVTDGASAIVAEQGQVQGELPLTPIQIWLCEQAMPNLHHCNMAVLLEVREALDPSKLKIAVRKLVNHHDALRMRFSVRNGEWRQTNLAAESHEIFHQEDLSFLEREKQMVALTEAAERWQRSLDVTQGPLLRIVWFDFGPMRPARLLMVIHHLVVDGVSWRILLEDLYAVYKQLKHGQAVTLPAKTTSFREWAHKLRDYAFSDIPEEPYWAKISAAGVPPLPVEYPGGANIEACTDEVTESLTEQQTQALLQEVPAVYRTRINDLLLATLAVVVCRWSNNDSLLIDLEGHGREHLFNDVDLSRTVGWFTTLFPVLLQAAAHTEPGTLIKTVKEQLRAIPQNGIGYGIRRHLSPNRLPEPRPTPQIMFNYLGQWDQSLPKELPFTPAFESTGDNVASQGLRTHEWEINCDVLNGRLRIAWSYSRERYSRPTIESLCREYKETLKTVIAHCQLPEAGGCTRSDFPLATLEQAELDRVIKDPRDVEDIYPLGSVQEGLLFHTLLNPHSGVYLIQDIIDIQGNLNVEAFRSAWQQVVDTHSVLRTAFFWDTDKRPHQIVYKRVAMPVELVDWREWNDDKQGRELRALLQAELDAGLLLSQTPILRMRLIRRSDDRWIYVRSHHHILLDAWCLPLLLVDFLAYYEAWVRGQPLPNKKVAPYREYIAWLRRQDMVSAEHLWRNHLRGFDTPAYLADGRRAVSIPRGEPAVADEIARLSRDDTTALHELARRHKLTPFTFMQAAWAVLMTRYTNRGEVVFGVTVAGRSPEIDQVEEMAGLFINTLPLRLRVEPNALLLDWLHELLTLGLEMRQFDYAPLVDMQKWSDVEPGKALFDSLVVFENVPVNQSLQRARLPLNIVSYESRTHSNYPLSLTIRPGEELDVELTYDRGLFDATTVARMLGHYMTLLEGMIHNPQGRLCDLPMLPENEHQQLLHIWNQTERSYPEPRDIVARFEVQVAQTPGAIAVACEGKQLTYRELNTRVNRVADALIDHGIGLDVIVALLDDRGVDFLVMMLGIFKAGGAYLPLEPVHPDARLAQVLQESRVMSVLTSAAYRERAQGVINVLSISPPILLTLPELEAQASAEHNPISHHAPQNLAFIIFTSGSTGTPKGAMVEHQGMFNNLITKVPALGLTSADVIAQTASQCFDISVWQFLTALSCGARVEVFPDAITHDPYRLLHQLATREVTVLEAVPSMIRALLDASEEGMELPKLRWLLPCGEALPPELCRRWMERHPHIQLLNAYGPAECSDDVSYHPIVKPAEADLSVPIGRPVDNIQLYLLNRWLEPVPVGVTGEICVSGVQVGRGYLKRPDLTAAAFIPDAFGAPGGRLYRTGDLGRYRNDGAIEFMGRIDHQVKIRGHRIEPGEIEAMLSRHPKVKDAVVLEQEESQMGQRLVAYVIPELQHSATVKGHQRYQLPNGMAIVHYLKNETDYLYRDIFDDRVYMRHGIMLCEGDCVFDVGANIGLFTLFVQQYCPNTKVYAFEPISPLFERLSINANLYGKNVSVFEYGLSNESGEVPFTFYPKSSLLSGRYADAQSEHQLVKSYIQNQQQRDSTQTAKGEVQFIDELLDGHFERETFVCPLWRLSQVIQEHGIERIDLLKIDVERSELDVIEGIEDKDWEKIRQLVIEVEDSEGRLANSILCAVRQHGA